MAVSRIVKILVGLGLVAGVILFIITLPKTISPAEIPARQANLDNGKLVFYAGGCASCHQTPGQDDRTLLGGGHELGSPFGSFFAPNISPHPERGIGKWTEAEFASAMLKGTSPKGEHYYPAFPYTSYGLMTLADVQDLFAFIKTLKPTDTPNRPHHLGFPFNVRLTLGGWKLLAFDAKPFTPDPAKSAELNRGAYLVEGMGHCAECHSERFVFGMIKPWRRFAGGPDPEGKGTVPNITPHKDGIGAWSDADIASLLTDGLTPEADVVGGTMGSVVKNMAQLPKSDIAAMVAYLRSLPSREDRPKK